MASVEEVFTTTGLISLKGVRGGGAGRATDEQGVWESGASSGGEEHPPAASTKLGIVVVEAEEVELWNASSASSNAAVDSSKTEAEVARGVSVVEASSLPIEKAFWSVKAPPENALS